MAKANDNNGQKTMVAGPTMEDRPKCGLVMPISSLDGLTENHWAEVKAILTDAVDAAGFAADLVSNADDIGIIQKRIIQNLYENPIVVCDVSGKNPNVMFELGMRLAFDKPTVIVKDDKTSYSFDTAPIEHVEYPRDLRFTKIVDFKKALGEKVKATFEKATKDPNYTTFLKHFGKFTVAKLETTEVSKEQFILEELHDLRQMLQRREASVDPSTISPDSYVRLPAEIKLIARTVVQDYAIEQSAKNLPLDPSMLVESVMKRLPEDLRLPKHRVRKMVEFAVSSELAAPW